MKYEETCAQGSFTVRGTGFRFNYDADDQLLHITSFDKKRALARLKLDQYLAKDPLAYVESFDKTNQIKALMYSNNATINLAETMDYERINSLIKITARISRCAFDLQTKNFKRFSRVFCKDFDLKNVKIKKFTSSYQSNELYLARIQTHYNNSVCVRACTLTGLTAALSDRTLRDLITMEFGHNYSNSAHSLLQVSSKLTTISHILDPSFIPEHKLKRYETLQDQIAKIMSTPLN